MSNLIKEIEDQYLNTGQVLTDGELLRRTTLMNEEYQRRINGGSNHVGRDEFGLPLTPFEVALKEVEKELEREGYRRDGLDADSYSAERLTRLMKWATKTYRKGA